MVIHWYNNGMEEHTFIEGSQPDGYERGRLRSVIEKQIRTEMSKPKDIRESQIKARAESNKNAHHKRTVEQIQRMKENSGRRGKPPWTAGLSKETDDRVREMSKSVSAGMKKYA